MEAPIQIISKDILALIPKFNGDQNLLKLFIKKVEYVLSNFNGPNTEKQKTYEFHAVTSRLRGQAAALVSETDDITTWEQLKEVLNQHFGDPRTEESLAIELENLKIKFNETYLEFYRRIQQIRTSLLSKVSALPNDEARADKKIIYNNLALNVFLYNLTEDLFRIVRNKSCNNLENALKVVMEEVNSQKQYQARNKSGFTNIHVKYNPVVGTDVDVKSGTSQSVNIKHHCITCMKEYENKSLEELRLEDYVAGRKGNTSGVFGGFQQTENKPLFGNTCKSTPCL